MRRIAIILAGVFGAFGVVALAPGERPEMPPIGEVATQPVENAGPGGAGKPTMPSINVEPMPDVEETPVEKTPAQTQPEKMATPHPETLPETQPATQPESRAATVPESQPAEEVTSAPATLPSVVVEEVRQKAELQFSFLADHPSGIYYAKEAAKISIIVELPSWASEPQTLSGNVTFMPLPMVGQANKPLSVTPIQEAVIKPGKRVKLTVAAEFPSPGEYVLAIGDKWINGAGGVNLRCMFAPRGAEGKTIDNSWVTKLPEGATEVPGVLADYVKRTGVRRFVLDETWGPQLTPEVKVLTKGKRELLLKNLAEAKGSLIVRWSLTSSATTANKELLAMNRYVGAFVAQAKGSIAAVCIDAGNAAASPADLERVRQYYLSIYDATKKQNKSTLMLGASSVADTEQFLTSPAKGEGLRSYVDVLCAEDSAGDVLRGVDRAAKKEWKGTPLWVLPHGGGMATAAVKALGAAVVPINPSDRNVPAHLFGGGVLLERLHPEAFPFVAVFQGDGFAVAAIAGRDAGTLLDASETKVIAGKPHFDSPAFFDAEGKAIEPHLEIGDDTNSLRVVDARGGAVDCRVGDLLKVPVDEQMYYVLATGSADDLASLIRVAVPHGVRVIEPRVEKFISPKGAEKGSLELSMQNMSPSETQGEALLLGADGEAIGAAKKFAAIAPGKSAQLSFALPPGLAMENARVEFRFKGSKEVQRNRLELGK